MVSRKAGRSGDLPGAENIQAGQQGIKRGDIFWGMLPESAGSEKKGMKPVLIIQNDVGNEYSPTVIAALITSRISKRPYPVNVKIPKGMLPKESEVRLNQILTLEKNRIGQKIATATQETMDQIDEALRVSLGLSGFE